MKIRLFKMCIQLVNEKSRVTKKGSFKITNYLQLILVYFQLHLAVTLIKVSKIISFTFYVNFIKEITILIYNSGIFSKISLFLNSPSDFK